MPRPALRRALSVWMNGERVGTWTLPSHGTETFTYASEWLDTEGGRPISLSMPLGPTGTAFRGSVVSSFFDCRISHLGTGRFPELGTTVKGSLIENLAELWLADAH